MARSIDQCREKIAALKKEQARYTNDKAYGPWFKIGGQIIQVGRRLDIMLNRKRQAERGALDEPIVLTGDPTIDTLNRIERARHEAKLTPAVAASIATILETVESVPLPAAVLANVAAMPSEHVATVVPEPTDPGLDAAIKALLPPSEDGNKLS
jgi:hypothetical protein